MRWRSAFFWKAYQLVISYSNLQYHIPHVCIEWPILYKPNRSRLEESFHRLHYSIQIPSIVQYCKNGCATKDWVAFREGGLHCTPNILRYTQDSEASNAYPAAKRFGLECFYPLKWQLYSNASLLCVLIVSPLIGNLKISCTSTSRSWDHIADFQGEWNLAVDASRRSAQKYWKDHLMIYVTTSYCYTAVA